MHLGQIHITNIVGRIIIANLASSPVQAFDFDNFAILDCSAEGNSYELAIAKLNTIIDGNGISLSGCHLFWS